MPSTPYVVDPTRDSFKQMFERTPEGVEVSMVNLVRFREMALDHVDAPPRTGEQAYKTYIRQFGPLAKTIGARIVWTGRVHHTLIAPDGEGWDEVLIVEYPSVAEFGSLIRSDAYKQILVHRNAGVLDTRLIVTTAEVADAGGENVMR